MSRPAGALTIHEGKIRQSNSGRGKARAGPSEGKGDKIWDVPKSAATKQLEALQEKLRGVQDGAKVSRDDHVPDCFCQGEFALVSYLSLNIARIHSLSKYTPHCARCGLIICELHPAYAPCPSCAAQLYTSAQLSRLVLKLSEEIAVQLQKEQDERDAQEDDRRQRLLAASGGGAFPTLPGGGAINAPVAKPAEQAYKVLSIGSSKGKGKGKATLTTTTTYRTSSPSTPTPEPSGPAIPTDIVPRPRSPPVDAGRRAKELERILAWRESEDRPWGDLKGERRGEVWAYVEPPIVEASGGDNRRRNGKKNREQVPRAIPGAA